MWMMAAGLVIQKPSKLFSERLDLVPVHNTCRVEVSGPPRRRGVFARPHRNLGARAGRSGDYALDDSSILGPCSAEKRGFQI